MGRVRSSSIWVLALEARYRRGPIGGEAGDQSGEGEPDIDRGAAPTPPTQAAGQNPEAPHKVRFRREQGFAGAAYVKIGHAGLFAKTAPQSLSQRLEAREFVVTARGFEDCGIAGT